MDAIDFLLADRFHVRVDEEGWYSEKILRLPNDYVCYAPPADAPAVAPLPALANGYLTFGCFNNPAKYSDRMIRAWAEILHRLPAARLLLKFSGLEDPRIQDDMRYRLASHGANGDRVLFEGWSSPSGLLATYNRIDVGLDTFPYSGGLTTCEALWMGAPVITFPGGTFAGRHSTSHLMNAGYGQFVANEVAGYVEIAVQCASRLDQLAANRSQMREKVRLSLLCDAPRFARDLLEVLRQAWRKGSA
jgi:predicted O-linked N-acetylglucosamine transferase (SPINDLY family)